MLSSNARAILTIVITIAALVGFVAMVGYALYQTWMAVDVPPTFSKDYENLVIGLTGLVGGIVTAGFAAKAKTSLAAPPGRMARSVTGVGSVVLGGETESAKKTVGVVYAATYYVVGAAAVVTWLLKGSVTPLWVKDLAAVVIGLTVTTVGAFFSET